MTEEKIIAKTIGGALGKAVGPGYIMVDGAIDAYRDTAAAPEGYGAKYGAQTVANTAASTAAFAGVSALGSSAVTATGATGAAALGLGALPLVASVGTAIGVAECANRAIETSRIYDDLDNSIRASVETLKNLKPMANGNYYMLKGSSYLQDAARDSRGNVDLTRIENVERMRNAIGEARNRYQEIMQKHDSWLPRWTRSGDSAMQYNTAKLDAQTCDAALVELGALEQHLQKVNETKAALAQQHQQKPEAAASSPAAENKNPGKPRDSKRDSKMFGMGSAIGGLLLAAAGFLAGGPPVALALAAIGALAGQPILNNIRGAIATNPAPDAESQETPDKNPSGNHGGGVPMPDAPQAGLPMNVPNPEKGR